MPCLHLADLLSYRHSDHHRHIKKAHLYSPTMTLHGLLTLAALVAMPVYAIIDCS